MEQQSSALISESQKPEKPAVPTSERRKVVLEKYALTLLPVTFIVIALSLVGRVPGSRTIEQWGDLTLSSDAISSLKPSSDIDGVVFETKSAANVKAVISGEVTKAGGHRIEITGDKRTDAQPPRAVYTGLTSIGVVEHQKVAAGTIIGRIEPERSYQVVARLRLQIFRGDKLLPPPLGLPIAFSSAGQKIFVTDCAGCHDVHGIGADVIKGGKLMRTGVDATADNIVAKIRAGGPGMPPFGETVLDKDDVASLVTFIQSRAKSLVS